jgi:hypothetical protein
MAHWPYTLTVLMYKRLKKIELTHETVPIIRGVWLIFCPMGFCDTSYERTKVLIWSLFRLFIINILIIIDKGVGKPDNKREKLKKKRVTIHINLMVPTVQGGTVQYQCKA